MSKIKNVIFTIAVFVILALAIASLKPLNFRNPKLAVSFLTQSNDGDRWVALFSITNLGDADALSFPQGEIEMFGQTNKTIVACKSNIRCLTPGKSDVVEVIIPTNIVGRLRFTQYYEHKNFRSSFYHWQWGTRGPGSRINILIPDSLKGVPLDETISDWFERTGSLPKTETGSHPN